MDKKETSPILRVFVSYSYSAWMDNRNHLRKLIGQLLEEKMETYYNSEPNDNSEEKNKLRSETNPQESE
jgi:hypothetical protein